MDVSLKSASLGSCFPEDYEFQKKHLGVMEQQRRDRKYQSQLQILTEIQQLMYVHSNRTEG